MKKVYRSCCGIDVHKKLIVACFLQKSNKSEVPPVLIGSLSTTFLSLQV